MLFAMGLGATTATAAPDATDIVRKADNHARGMTSKTEVVIQVTRPDWSREMALTSWSQGRDLALIRVTAPARDKGTAFLKRGHEVWNWVPSAERAIKLPPSMMSQSWMGTDMTNEDFVKESSIIDDYTQKLVGVDTLLGLPCYRIELKPKPGAAVVWGKIEMGIDMRDFMELKSKYYDEDGQLVNTLTAEEAGTLGGRRLPTRLVMQPADKPGNKTTVIYKSMSFDQKLPPDLFTERHLSEMR